MYDEIDCFNISCDNGGDGCADDAEAWCAKAAENENVV